MKLKRHRQLSASFSPGVLPTFEHESRIWLQGFTRVAGVDEAGRGAWAGPLVAAAAILPSNTEDCALLAKYFHEAGVTINDSKRLTRSSREHALELAIRSGVNFEFVEIPASVIDAIGVGNANHLALKLAIERFVMKPDHVLIDYFSVFGLTMRSTSLTKGDQRSVSIALASIAAKVHRDALMVEIGCQNPGYSFEQHMGYGTKKHIEALNSFGVIDQHRRSFKPVRQALASAQ